MKRKVVWTLLTFAVLVGASLKYAPSASSSSSNRTTAVPRAAAATFNPLMPLATTLDVDRTDDTAAASACTAAPNDCSLRGAIIAANADAGANPVDINLQPATTYNLTLTNAAQENAAATGDLDIAAANHEVRINGGGSTVSAAGLNVGAAHDRVFHVVSGTNNVTFADVTVADGRASDDGTAGASTVNGTQTTMGTGGGILNNGGSVTLTNVTIRSCEALGRGDSVVNNFNALAARGGGLASLTATGNVVITGSTLTSNTATGGNGGNFNNGSGSGARGGSIYFEGGTLDISGSRILLSSASGGDGGDGPGNQQNGGVGGAAHGGGAYVGGGTVSINDTTFESCVAAGGDAGTGQNGGNFGGEGGGGGLYSLGSVTVTNSTFNMDGATGGRGGDAFGPDCFGGHIALDGGAARGGAILADGGSLVVNTATFASNFADGGDGGDGGPTNVGSCSGSQHGAGGLAHGGAITNNNAANVNVKHATLSLNSARAGDSGVNQGGANMPPRLAAEGTGGGIRVGPGGVTLENTIIAGNTAANGAGDATGAPTPGPNVDGAVNSNGHNLLGNATEATGFAGPGDQTGADPLLMPLADNGGPTKTLALSPGSPAIDAGVAAGAAFDQRGKPRTFDDPGVADGATSDGTDVGAFELQPECSLSCTDDVTVSNDPDACGAFVDYAEPSGEGCGTVTCDYPSGSFFPVGETTVTCTSSAGPSCSFKVTVNDTQAPDVTTHGPFKLWPPDHKYVTFDVQDLVAGAVDNCDAGVGLGGVRITKVTSDEPDNGGGDGNTTNDILIAADCKSLKLRSERAGGGNGRVYTITFEVSDASGNVGTATTNVAVPPSKNGSPAVDDGPQHTVLGGCP